jgi:hypothetical protein
MWAGLLVLVSLGKGATQPTLKPIGYGVETGYSGLEVMGEWPGFRRGLAHDVQVVSSYAYVADGNAGLQVIDISNLTDCFRAGGCDTSGYAGGVRVIGSYAYVADRDAGLEVIDVSNPSNCFRAGGYDTSGSAKDVHLVGSYVYVADGEAGLLVLRSHPNAHFSLEVDATPGTPFTIEAAMNLEPPLRWEALLTTNSATMPFPFTDFEVREPQKFYRVRAP